MKKGCESSPFQLFPRVQFLMDLSGPVLETLKTCNSLILWLRGLDLNQRPLGYEIPVK
jgi:hypothetical protein